MPSDSIQSPVPKKRVIAPPRSSTAAPSKPPTRLADGMLGRETPASYYSNWESVAPPSEERRTIAPQDSTLAKMLTPAYGTTGTVSSPLAAAQQRGAGLADLHQGLVNIQQQAAAGQLPMHPRVAADVADIAHDSLLDVGPGHHAEVPELQNMMMGKFVSPEVQRQRLISANLPIGPTRNPALTHEQTIAAMQANGHDFDPAVASSVPIANGLAGVAGDGTANTAAYRAGIRANEAASRLAHAEARAKSPVQQAVVQNAIGAADQRRERLLPGITQTKLYAMLMGQGGGEDAKAIAMMRLGGPEALAVYNQGMQGRARLALDTQAQADAREHNAALAGIERAKVEQTERLAQADAALKRELQGLVNSGQISVAQAEHQYALERDKANNAHSLEVARLNQEAAGTIADRAALGLATAGQADLLSDEQKRRLGMTTGTPTGELTRMRTAKEAGVTNPEEFAKSKVGEEAIGRAIKAGVLDDEAAKAFEDVYRNDKFDQSSWPFWDGNQLRFISNRQAFVDYFGRLHGKEGAKLAEKWWVERNGG